MDRRFFTVGSLIPGKMVPIPQSPAIKRDSLVEKIILMQGDNKFEISPAKGKLLEVALNQGKPIRYKCRKGTCGQCTVKVLQGQGLSAPNEQEHKKLYKELDNGYRLACQAEIQ